MNRRLSTELKRQRGTLRPGREIAPAASLELGLPEPPDGLPERVLGEYWRLANVMLEAGTVTAADGGAILGAARAIIDHAEACEAIERTGSIFVETENGPRVHPAVRVRNDADKRARSWLQSLGLTPVDRARVPAAPRPKEKSGLAQLLELSRTQE